MKTTRLIQSFFILLFSASLFGGILSARADDINYVTTVEGTPNLLGYWRFSPDSQANSEVNGYTGTFESDAMVGALGSGPMLAGDPNNTPVVLDGTNNTYVTTDLTGQINQQGSMVGWFYLTALPSEVGHTEYIAGESAGGDDFDVQVDGDNYIRFYTEAGGNVASAAPLTDGDLNKWHFVATTFTASSDRQIYIDGNLSGSNVPGGHSVNSSPFTMGASSVFGGRFFNGALDEIALYDRDLTAAEVAAIYNSATQQTPPLQLTDSVSRKVQGSAGTFDIELPPDGSGIECRQSAHTEQFVFTFNNDIANGSASLTTQKGGAISGDPVISGNTITVNLTGVNDEQVVIVTLSGVTDVYGQTLPDTAIAANILVADVDGDGTVTKADLTAVQGQVGMAVTASNFRDDINATGSITGEDVKLVRTHRNTTIQ
ncbi:MAG TPA: LamG-like jellyroll fold domain-containing protein [Chthoniobacterales bacterium]